MTHLLDLYQMASQANIEVDCFEMGKREAFSVMDTDGRCYIAIDPFRLTSSMDERLKLSHELGHCMTGSFYNADAACDVRQKHERRADRWAVEHLITADELEAAVADGYTNEWELAEYFDVTPDFVRKAACYYTYGNLAAELYF